MGAQSDEVTGGGNTNDNDARVEQIAADIDETRDELTGTVREIGTRLEPSNLAREASATVRGATIGKVEMMSIGAQETWRDVRSGNAGGIVDMVRENPVPAGMIGLGLAIMFLNRGSRSGTGGMDGRGRQRWQTNGYGRYAYDDNMDWYQPSSGSSPVDQMGSMASSARDQMGSVASNARDAVGDAADRVSDSVNQMATDLPQQAGAMIDTGTWQARRMIDENPLGAGIIAIAAGAAIGMLLPTTPFERETVGPVRDQVVDQAANAAEDAIDSAKRSMHSDGSSGAGQGSTSQG